jgi:hypothetical protein
MSAPRLVISLHPVAPFRGLGCEATGAGRLSAACIRLLDPFGAAW